MSKADFLREFIDEEIYIIKNENKTETDLDNESNIVEEPASSYNEVEINYHGGNKRHISIVIQDSSSEFINEADLNFLSKILGAIKLSINDVAIINTNRYPQLTIDHLAGLECEKCLVFDPKNTLVNMELYQIESVQGIDFMRSESLKNLSINVEEKRKLWATLQKVFS